MTIRFGIFLVIFISLISFFHSCVEKVDGEFDFKSGIIFIDAYALTEPGISTVSINKSIFEFNTYKLEGVENAKVKIVNEADGTTIDFLYDTVGIYNCPSNFAVASGEVWKLMIELEDGKKIESKPQTVTTVIPIENINVEYSSEIAFDADFDRFIPGHRISIDWTDPENEENFYLWKFKTFEPLFVCKRCERGIFRNGRCQPNSNSFGPPYTDYLCDPTCWEIKFGDELPIFEDRLANGTEIKNREITIVPYLRRADILIEVQQFSLNQIGYDYFKIINDQISANSGLNAPPPAALLGNLFNPDDVSDLVLGQFTTAGVSTKSFFIDRSGILDLPLRPDDPIRIETCPSCPVLFPCVESSFRTSIKPDGWP